MQNIAFMTRKNNLQRISKQSSLQLMVAEKIRENLETKVECIFYEM